MDFNSIALSGVVREFANLSDTDIVVVCDGGLPESRRCLGWAVPSIEGVEVITLPQDEWQLSVCQIIDRRNEGVHLFNGGTTNVPRVHFAFSECVRREIKTGIVSEPPVNQEIGWRRWAKSLYLRTVLPSRVRPVARRAKFLLALTDAADDSFLDLGWKSEQVYPFGYFSDIVPAEFPPLTSNQVPRLVYLGKLLPHKALDILIRAAGMVRSQSCQFHLDLYGTGPLRDELSRQIRQQKLEDTVVLHDPVSCERIASILKDADILVAPGLTEPWGFAVNEGIQAGAAIVVSDGIRGGRSLVKFGGCGKIVRAGDAQDMARAIAALVTNPEELLRCRQQAWQYSRKILPRTAAEYLCGIIKYEQQECSHRPVAPWVVGSTHARCAEHAGTREA